MTSYRRCQECKEIKPLTSENFRRAGTSRYRNQPTWSGVCLECRPVTVKEQAEEARKRIIASMPKAHLRSMCENKKRYPSREHALNAQMKYARTYKGKKNRVYECPVCGRYHISTKDEWGG